MRIEDTIQKIGVWARARNIIKGSTPAHQMLKATEEFGELAAAIARKDEAKIKDSIGDVMVCINNLALQHDTSLQECSEIAYNDIKNRKGKMRDGVFIKESDL